MFSSRTHQCNAAFVEVGSPNRQELALPLASPKVIVNGLALAAGFISAIGMALAASPLSFSQDSKEKEHSLPLIAHESTASSCRESELISVD